MPIIVAHQEMSPVSVVLRAYPSDQYFRSDALGFGTQHDGRPVCVGRANEVQFVALHALKSHPNVAIELIDDVADVQGAVGVRECSGGKYFSRHQKLLRRGERKTG